MNKNNYFINMIKIIYKNNSFFIEKDKLIKKSRYFENLLNEFDVNEIETIHNIKILFDDKINLKKYYLMEYYLCDLTDFIDKINSKPIESLKLYIEISKKYNLDQSLSKTNLMDLKGFNKMNIINIINLLEKQKFDNQLNLLDFDIKYHQLNNQNFKMNDQIYFENEKHIINNIDEFKIKLNDFSFGIIKDELFKSENVIIAGGSVLNLILKKPRYYENSDIDIFIKNDKEILKNVLKYFENYDVSYELNKSVINIKINNIKKIFQIIFVDAENNFDIIDSFDLDYCKCYYDGKNIYCSPDFLKSITYMTVFTNSFDKYNYEERITKAWMKGFNINSSNKILNELPNKEFKKQYIKFIEFIDDVIAFTLEDKLAKYYYTFEGHTSIIENPTDVTCLNYRKFAIRCHIIDNKAYFAIKDNKNIQKIWKKIRHLCLNKIYECDEIGCYIDLNKVHKPFDGDENTINQIKNQYNGEKCRLLFRYYLRRDFNYNNPKMYNIKLRLNDFCIREIKK